MKLKEINYFDLGLHKDAKEIDMFVDICKKNKIKYNVWGFEAHPKYCDFLEKKYENDINIKIINKAISNENGILNLYISESNDGEGNSIFKTKKNVNKENFISVDCILFSDWILKNIPNFKNENNILRFNIEGAEWHLMNDLNDNNMLNFFKLFLGSNTDIPKVSEINKYLPNYLSILKKNNITIHRFVKDNPKNNCNLENLIKKIK